FPRPGRARPPPSGGPMNTSLPSDLENRVRDAYQAAGRTVQPQTLRRTTPGIAAGPSRRSRRLKALIPVAAAVAVLAVIGASVALPRLLTGAAGKPGNSASALAHDPPFQVIVTSTLTRSTSLLVRTPAGSLPVQLGWLAADADGGVIAFSGQRSGGAFVVGAVIGNQVKQWSVAEKEATIGSVSVTSAGDKIAFITQYNGPGSHFAAMVLATGSAPGSLLTRAKTAGSYDYPRKDWYMFSVAIS